MSVWIASHRLYKPEEEFLLIILLFTLNTITHKSFKTDHIIKVAGSKILTLRLSCIVIRKPFYQPKLKDLYENILTGSVEKGCKMKSPFISQS